MSGRAVAKIAGVVALLSTVLACGVSGESSTLSDDDKSGGHSAPTEPVSGGSGGSAEDGENVCAPTLGGLIPAAIAPLKVQCPSGYEPRDASKALPVAGRFTSDDELVKAYCVKIAAVPPKTTIQGDMIDFRSNDVVAFAYDAKAGPPALFRRGEELWLQTKNDTCTGSAPSLVSVAFIIPKHVDVSEQSCTRLCK